MANATSKGPEKGPSGAAMNKFHTDVAKLEALENRRKEIINNALKAETELGNLRIAKLEEFFSVYDKRSKELSDVLTAAITKKTSELEDVFLLLDGLVEGLAADTRKAVADSVKEAKKETAASKSKDKPKSEDSGGEKKTDGGSGGSGGGGNSSGGGKDTPKPAGKNVAQEFDDDSLDALTNVTLEDLESRISGFGNFLRKTADEQINILTGTTEDTKDAVFTMAEVEEQYSKARLERLREQEAKAKKVEETILGYTGKLLHAEEEITANMLDLKLAQQQEAASAKNAAIDAANELQAQIRLATDPAALAESSEYEKETADAKARAAEDKKIQEALLKDKAKLERLYRNKDGEISKKDQEKIAKTLEKRYKDQKKNEENLSKERQRLSKIEQEKENAADRDKLRQGVGALTASGASFAERKQALYELTHNEQGNFSGGKALSAALVAVSDLAKQLESKIDSIAAYKGDIDTRLQGSGNEKHKGSYWDQLVRDMTSVGAVNPYFKQETFAENIRELVKQGISFDLKQRAFLMTVQNKIASTFEVTNSTLLRLVRIQQEDSTAGRMGMESALNSFLNEMYETSEYLESVAKSVKGSLEEMEALMSGAEAAEVEWQVQKWLGSLHSVGMSDDAVTSISNALGQIAAGQIEGLVNGGAGNLLIMAANDAGLSIADILTDGINSKDTNELLQASVNYLAELAESAKDNKVVQQQLADVFGVKASDLKAATNLVIPGSTTSIYNKSLSYANMITQLNAMASTMGDRTSVADMMTNFWENGQYTLAGSMASNPVSYFIYKMAKVVDSAAGGIDLPFLNVMGFGVDLNTTVSDLMRLAAVSGGILGSIGPMISGLGNSFNGQKMLNQLGISSGSGLAVTPRGSGGGGSSTGGGSSSTSGSGYVGNSSGSDIKDSTIQESEDSKKQQMIEAKEEEEANQVNVLNSTVLQIFELLNDVAQGKSSFRVKVESYGLTKASTSGSTGGMHALSGATGGAGAGGGGATGGSGGGGAGGITNSESVPGNLNLGGWVMA